jgi:hypothetical protein
MPRKGEFDMVTCIDASIQVGIGPGPVSLCTDNFGFGPSPGTDDLTKQSVSVQ